jgi:hypothetical protein
VLTGLTVGLTSIPKTIGLNPMVMSVITGYDGGKYITGNGQFTKTATFGWVIKLFGTVACASATTASTPTGYVLWTIPTPFVPATTQATCIT